MEFLRRSEVLLQNHDSPEDLAEMFFTSAMVQLGCMSRIPYDERNSKARTEQEKEQELSMNGRLPSARKIPAQGFNSRG